MTAVVVGVTMVRNEDDIIEATLTHMLRQVDAVVVIDNGSTDRTAEILNEIGWSAAMGGRLFVTRDTSRAYLQSERMTRAANFARVQYGADWIMPFDADEFWLAPDWRDGQTVADRLRECDWLDKLSAGMAVVKAPILNHYCTALDPASGSPFNPACMPWRTRTPLPLHKVAYRWAEGAVIEMGNHGVSLPGVEVSPYDAGITIRHYPYRSAAQMTRKAVQGAEAYRAAGDAVPADAGAHWRAWGELIERRGESVMGDIFREHYWFLSPTDAGMIHDPLEVL